jgi:hypothetical protein
MAAPPLRQSAEELAARLLALVVAAERVAMTVAQGTCSATGACRPRGCRNAGMGLEISKCTSAECFATNACPYGDPITKWDEPSELCKSGPNATCTLAQGMGCCSLLGACCPAPMLGPTSTCPPWLVMISG